MSACTFLCVARLDDHCLARRVRSGPEIECFMVCTDECCIVGCGHPEPYYPRTDSGACAQYWKGGNCTYWLNGGWRDMCLATGWGHLKQQREIQRKRAMTPTETAEEDGRLF